MPRGAVTSIFFQQPVDTNRDLCTSASKPLMTF